MGLCPRPRGALPAELLFCAAKRVTRKGRPRRDLLTVLSHKARGIKKTRSAQTVFNSFPSTSQEPKISKGDKKKLFLLNKGLLHLPLKREDEEQIRLL